MDCSGKQEWMDRDLPTVARSEPRVDEMEMFCCSDDDQATKTNTV